MKTFLKHWGFGIACVLSLISGYVFHMTIEKEEAVTGAQGAEL